MADHRVHVQREPAINIGQPPPAQAVQTPLPVVYQQAPPQQPIIIERAFKQTTTKRRIENDTSDDR